MSRVIHFEIPTEVPERALTFYESVFGWKCTKWEGPMDYWLIETGDPDRPGINGGLMLRHDPAQPVTNTIEISDLAATTARIEAAGGVIVVPKMAIPGVGWLSYFKDTEGNIFGFMQSDPAAA